MPTPLRIPMSKVVYQATKKQAYFHAAPEMYKLFGGAMGGGKSWALCAEAIALSQQYPGNRGYLCRDTFTAFRRTTLMTLEAMLDRAGLVEQHHQSAFYFLLKNGSIIMYGGLGDDKKAIEKLKSMDLGFFGIDEASETSESYFLMLSTRLRLKLPGIKYFGLLASNPDPGWLKRRFIDQKLPDHVFIQALPGDNPQLAEGYLDRLKSILPEEWQKRYIQGDWTAFEGVNSVFPYSALIESQQIPQIGKRKKLGVDVARYGDDSSVIALREGNTGHIIESVQGSDLMTVTGLVVRAAKDNKPVDDINVDADGMGAGVVDRLRELGHPVSEIHAGERAQDPDRFSNKKAEMYWEFRELILNGEVRLPEDLELLAQMASCSYRIKSSGQIEIVSKEEMKKMGMKSPDRAEAMIYAFTEPPSGPWIRSLA